MRKVPLFEKIVVAGLCAMVVALVILIFFTATRNPCPRWKSAAQCAKVSGCQWNGACTQV
jgi:hypothetical protein